MENLQQARPAPATSSLSPAAAGPPPNTHTHTMQDKEDAVEEAAWWE